MKVMNPNTQSGLAQERRKVKHITLSIDDETYRQARAWAAWHDTSVSALVEQFLQSICGKRVATPRLE